MTLRVLSLAEDDLLRGFKFYERQGSGLGWYFLETLSSDIESLRLYAGIHPRVFGYHRMLSKRFPFGIYYDVRRNEVRILAGIGLQKESILDPAPAKKGRPESLTACSV